MPATPHDWYQTEQHYTGWFADDDWHHFAFVRNETGYATYYDGYQVGKNVPAADYDCFMPSGHTKFYFGGLPTGRFGKFNTGFNQQFISGSDTDLLLQGMKRDLLSSNRVRISTTEGPGETASDQYAKESRANINSKDPFFIKTPRPYFSLSGKMNEVSEQKEEIISSLILSLRIFPTVVSINSILKKPN